MSKDELRKELEILRDEENTLRMETENLISETEKINDKLDVIFSNINKIVEESKRVACVAENAKSILDDLDRQFEEKTGLKQSDIGFLFFAVGFQLARIALLNELTKIELAGSTNSKETKLYKLQNKLLKNFDFGSILEERPYYASKNHIISSYKVPYDTTRYLDKKYLEDMINRGKQWDFDIEGFVLTEKPQLFKGANHRFSTLGHDPTLGLIFGTSNIMTNTITCINKPFLTTNHVIYTSKYDNPSIAMPASTIIMFKEVIKRIKEEPSVFVASIIKQIIHIGTDMYTSCGIQIPIANLVLSKNNVENITKYIDFGMVFKGTLSYRLSELINLVVKTFYIICNKKDGYMSTEMNEIKARKIIKYSNIIATGSNVIWVAGNFFAENKMAIKKLDLGGLIVILKHLRTDKEFIRKIKEEFVFGSFNDVIQGQVLDLEEILWD